MSINFGRENINHLIAILGDDPVDPVDPVVDPCEGEEGTHGVHCWKSTADISPGLWVAIALAIPIVVVLFILHRKQKFTCCGQYNPLGLENRIAWFGEMGLAIFFLIEMFIGEGGGAIGQIWDMPWSEGNNVAIMKCHAFVAVLTVVLRIVMSLIVARTWCKDGNYKTTIPFRDLYSEKDEAEKYMTEDLDIGITVFFSKRHYW